VQVNYTRSFLFPDTWVITGDVGLYKHHVRYEKGTSHTYKGGKEKGKNEIWEMSPHPLNYHERTWKEILT